MEHQFPNGGKYVHAEGHHIDDKPNRVYLLNRDRMKIGDVFISEDCFVCVMIVRQASIQEFLEHGPDMGMTDAELLCHYFYVAEF